MVFFVSCFCYDDMVFFCFVFISQDGNKIGQLLHFPVTGNGVYLYDPNNNI